MVIAIEGTIELVPVVSQGCRPVGKPWVITDCERNLIKKLGGKPALEVLLETLNELAQGKPRARQNIALPRPRDRSHAHRVRARRLPGAADRAVVW